MTITDIRNRWQQSPIPFSEIAEIGALFAEIGRLAERLESAERRAQYWKDAHLADDAEISRLERLLAEKGESNGTPQ